MRNKKLILIFFFFFFFNDTATTEIYTLSLHDALPIWLSRARYRSWFCDGVSGDVVCVPRLRLERQENRDPLVGRREAEDERAVLPHPVVMCELRVVSLIHVDVVDAVARHEPENLVLLVLLRSPALAENVHFGVVLQPCPRDVMLDPVTEVIIRAWQVVRQGTQPQAVEEVAPDKI